MQIRDFLRQSTATLTAAGISSARLDVLVLLGDELNKDKAWLLAHDDTDLTADQLEHLHSHISRRAAREPLAYIRGHQEFYGRDFIVSADVLIPRPETETIIELLPNTPNLSLLDVGTGSGAIAITAQLDHPTWAVTATDIDEEALLVAAHNADRLNATLALRHSNLLSSIKDSFDIITANLPYVDETWQRNSPETEYEPALALFADEHGLALIHSLLAQAPDHLTQNGLLLLESDPEQHKEIVENAQKQGLSHVQTLDYIVVLRKS